MSLLTTPTLQALYRKAAQNTGLEHETITFWDHLLSKVYFSAEYFVISHQKPPSDAASDRLRRVDFSIGRIDFSTDELSVIAFVEGKRTKAGENDYQAVEAQCFDACEAHLLHRVNCKRVYGICVVGTEAQILLCWRDEQMQIRFASMTHGNYYDADGPDATILHELFTEMEQSAQPRILQSTSVQPSTTPSAAPTTSTTSTTTSYQASDD
ncbi:hypothetical protein N0V90_012830 [Kalmusia sp. IMI 367209]|nr:hypothetical protein N0V90_012830 [Kalmusia sp. IMI 367209]